MKNRFLASLIDKANNVIAVDKLEQEVADLRTGIHRDLNNRMTGMDGAVGKTVARIWYDYEKYVLIFKDTTYIAFSTDSYEQSENPYTMVVGLTVDEGIKAGLVEPREVRYLREAEKAWQAPLDLLAAKKQLREAIMTLGPDAVKDLIGERQSD